MSMEKYWDAVAPVLFTVGGTTSGLVTVASAAGFKVGQLVQIAATPPLPTLTLKIKRIPSPTTIVVGPVDKGIEVHSDVSAYTVAAGANISASLQRRPSIPLQEIERAIFSEEPAVAQRVLPVDEFGQPKRMQLSNPIITEPFDTITAAYPNAVTEVYTYYDGGVIGSIVGTITVVYTDITKDNLLSMSRT